MYSQTSSILSNSSWVILTEFSPITEITNPQLLTTNQTKFCISYKQKNRGQLCSYKSTVNRALNLPIWILPLDWFLVEITFFYTSKIFSKKLFLVGLVFQIRRQFLLLAQFLFLGLFCLLNKSSHLRPNPMKEMDFQ